jgi:hypothetical protein
VETAREDRADRAVGEIALAQAGGAVGLALEAAALGERVEELHDLVRRGEQRARHFAAHDQEVGDAPGLGLVAVEPAIGGVGETVWRMVVHWSRSTAPPTSSPAGSSR